MPFVFLLVFALISFQTVWPGPAEEIARNRDWLTLYVYGSLLLPFLTILGFWGISAWRVERYRSQLISQPDRHSQLWRDWHRGNRRQLLLLTGCYLAVLYGAGWGYAAQICAAAWGVGWLLTLILFAPLMLALVLCWAQFFRAERLTHVLSGDPEPFAGPWGYQLFQIRHSLLLVVPPIVLSVSVQGFLVAVPAQEQDYLLFGTLGLLLLGILCVPLILRVFLGLRHMPAGPLRDRLEAAARRLGLGYSDILVWNTRQSVANAMVSGTLPWLRYIVLTDLLIDKLSPDEIEAVFGHEVGHIKHRHMLLYILFFVGSLAMLSGLWKCCESVLQPPPVAAEQAAETAMTQVAADPVATAPAATAPVATAQIATAQVWGISADIVAGPMLLAMVSLYIFLVFGYLSRRCELQADLYGCRAVSSEAFIAALDKVADLNGIPRKRASWLTGWQHPSIAQRIAFIERVRDNPVVEPLFQRSLLKLKLGLMSALTFGLSGVAALVAWQFGPDHILDIFQVR